MDAAPKGIGGWLILPAIGIVVSPFVMAHDGYSTLSPLLDESVWAVLNDPASEFYHPMWSAYFTGTLVLNALLFAATLYVAWLFFTKSARLPGLYIAWQLALVATQIIDVATAKLGKFPMVGMTDAELYREPVRAIIIAAIWIPYFLHSERVKNTFTNGAKAAPRAERREPTIGQF